MKPIAASFYRLRQFLWALRADSWAWSSPDLSAYLSSAQQDLFRQMSRPDQRHSIAVLQALEDAGVTDPFLLQAALLHDVGKIGGKIRIWHRIVAVLAEALSPAILKRLAVNRPGNWRYPFYLYLQHPARGADMARRAGSAPLVVELIRYHHAPGPAEDVPELGWRLELLRHADSSR